MPQVTWEPQPHGVWTISVRKMPDGRTFRRISEAGLPTLRVIPSPRMGRYGPVESLGWVLPIDDHSFRIYVVGRVREEGELTRMRSAAGGDPAGVSFDPEAPPVAFTAGNFLED